MEREISNSLAKKFERKLKRFIHLLEKETTIKASGIVTKHIAICNAGLVNGLTEEIVFENFEKMGEINNITMLPGKSCCFVTYKDKDSSCKAYEKFNGKLHIGQNNKPIYLLYAENVPEIKNFFETEKPTGLFVLKDFITEEEEKSFLDICNFAGDEKNKILKHRHTQHYGFEFLYGINNIKTDEPLKESIPIECDFLWGRLHAIKPEFRNFKPDQLTVNHYKPGQGISAHVDTHSACEDPILSLSLGSVVVMDFKRDNRSCSVLLPRRSLAIFSGECRYAWTHGITPRKFDIIPKDNTFTILHRGVRTSYTFRKTLKGECYCDFPEKCDSYKNWIETQNIENAIAADVEVKHVQKVYDNIATHFSDTRSKPWPNVAKFLDSFELGSIVIDVGCGNGKYLGCVKKIASIGCDYSQGLVELCRNRGFEVFNCNCLYVPLKDNSADGVFSIAVIHHLANYQRRLRAMKEMTRVLRVGGKGLIYVWAKDQQRNGRRSTYLKQDAETPSVSEDSLPIENISIANDISLPVHVNRTNFQYPDMLVPWKLQKKYAQTVDSKEDDKVFLRYYHVFENDELRKMCEEVNCIKVEKYYYDEGNWCCIFQKYKD